MTPLIILAMSARSKLAQRCARELAVDRSALAMSIADLERRLQLVFPAASVVIVQDLYEGFRRRTGEFVLLVEVTQNGVQTGPAVVKLGPADRLQKELSGYQSCRPEGLKHDLVMMDLEPVCDNQQVLQALVYADAEQLIGVDQTLTLETAMLDAVRLGEPTVESVADLLFQLYERLGMILYRHSFDDHPDMAPPVNSSGQPVQPAGTPKTPAKQFEPAFIDPNLTENVRRWNEESSIAMTVRAGVTTTLEASTLRKNFRDPVFMLNFIINQQQPGKFVPRMLRGRAHGDLHGRNVLVGKVRNRVLWPAVYDFGDMGPANLIGWDFVKLETEFKIRAYPQLFAPSRFATDVTQFEVQLFEATERGRESEDWFPLPTKATPAERLIWLLLQLRRLAMVQLSQNTRGRLWLMEYYFLLAVYGLSSARFDNLTQLEQKGAYLSAGCAAARYLPVA